MSTRPARLLLPVVALMDRLRYAHKFFFIGAILLIPTGYTLWLQHSGSTASIEFNAKERIGIDYIVPARDLLAVLQRQRLARVAALLGNAQAAREHAALNATLPALIAKVDAVDVRHGAALRTTERWRTIKTNANSLRSTQFATARQADAAYNGVTDAIIDLILNYAGNYSNLILDPDLDSYWLMDAWVIKMPLLGELASELATQTLLRDGDPRARAITVAGTYRQVLSTANDLLNVNMAVALKENPSGTIATLDAPAKDAVGVLRDLAETVRRAALTSDPSAFSEADAHHVTRATLAAIQHSHAFHARIGPVLDGLCAARVAKYSRERSSGLAASSFAALLLSYLFAGFFVSVRRALRGLGEATERMIAGTTERFMLPSRDEVGDLAGAYNQINAVLVEARVLRTRIQTVLDNTGDGLITCDLSGRVADAISQSAAVWFGAAQVGTTEVESYLFDEPRGAASFRLGLMQIADDILPFALLVDQLPATLSRAGREFRLSYQPILDEQKLTRLLIVVRDVTDELVAQRAQHDAEDVRAILANILRDREGFALLRRDVESLLQQLLKPDGEAEAWKRFLHTLKGNLAVYGFSQLADQVHTIEDMVSEPDFDRKAFDELEAAWRAMLEKLAAFVSISDRGTVEIREEELTALLHALESGSDRRSLWRMAAMWRTTPVATLLERLARQAQRIAERSGKKVECEVLDNGVRVERDNMTEFWSSLVHVVRNAIDHGIEQPGERHVSGKGSEGVLRFKTALEGGSFVVTITDDGRGVDWEKVRQRAAELGLPSATQPDLERALFVSGLTTTDTVTELSGRGVGFSAVATACEDLGGTVQVTSELGGGTAVSFTFQAKDFVSRSMLPGALSLAPAGGAQRAG